VDAVVGHTAAGTGKVGLIMAGTVVCVLKSSSCGRMEADSLLQSWCWSDTTALSVSWSWWQSSSLQTPCVLCVACVGHLFVTFSQAFSHQLATPHRTSVKTEFRSIALLLFHCRHRWTFSDVRSAVCVVSSCHREPHCEGN